MMTTTVNAPHRLFSSAEAVAVLEAASLPERCASDGRAGNVAPNPSYEATPDGGNRQDDNEYEETMRSCADGFHPEDQIEAGWAWEGDPDVINGTRTWRIYRCRFCGEEWS